MTRFIAEVCSNHNGDIERAIKIIKAAKDIGCDGVKFQLFRIDKLFTQSLLDHPEFESINKRRQWELPLDWLPKLAEACREHKIHFGCSPFYLDAVDQLQPYVDFYKVASYELTWPALLDKILSIPDKPVILSTGMATLEEIQAAIFSQTIKHWDAEDRLTLLHCISQYPVEPKDCHLDFIDEIRAYLNSSVGYSDHSANAGVIHRAVHQYRAGVIEFHLDLDDKLGFEYYLGHCWTPSKMKDVIDQVRDGLMADGKGTFDPTQNPERHFRTSPTDGLRPMTYIRQRLKNATKAW